MDKVERRSERVFIQSMGRVLRLDKAGRKKYGLVVDVRAKSSIEVCNRVQHYLKLKDVFPWHYALEVMREGSKTYYINSLTMKEGTVIEGITYDMERYDKSDITKQFVRDMPKGEEYAARLDKEITLMLEKNLFGNVMRAMEILALTKDIPHVTRGSCGSSLFCSLLGISHVDPVKHNISFARFINQYRTTLPDIDFDFPHYLRDEVFLKLFQKWGSKVARISNHNYYHEKSALRESLRRNGVNEFISKYELQKKIDSFDKDFQEQIYDTQKELDGTFRGYSLHCGGIIYFPDGVPQEYILDESERKIIPQVHLNKYDVSEQKTFKIDILSSRALSQLYYCRHFMDIDFNSHLGDEATIALLCSGNNVGITLAETPLMKKALILVQPKTIMDLAICLAIIRPAAKDAKKEFEMGKVKKHTMIFDDDIIQLLAKLFKCDEELADKFRRGYCKDDKETHRLIDKKLSVRPKSTQTRIKNILSNLRKYGFCKSHALSYAQLVWQLAYEKAHHPEIFWKSTLKNTKTCYRKWVHIYEARCSGVDHSVKDNEGSLYAKQRHHDYSAAKPLEQLRNAGYWYGSAFYNGCYYTKRDDLYLFHGVVASSRLVKRGKRSLLILCVGISEKTFIEVLVNGRTNYNTKKVLVQGRGALKRDCEHFPAIECKAKEMMFI
jgi:DNA polymerase III alpha subunit